MKNIGYLFILFLATLFVGAGDSSPLLAQQDQSPPRAYIIPITGEVDQGLAVFIRRAIRQGAGPESIFILEIDTFGGRVDAALQIVDILLREPEGKTVAYVTDKAISAGALIALACADLYMAPHTTLGDVAPITYSEEGPKVMGEKFQSPLRAKFRALAKKNNYPPTLAEAMVTAEMEVHRVETAEGVRYFTRQEYEEFIRDGRNKELPHTIVVAEGELLTMDDVEAGDLGFSRKTVDSRDALLALLGVPDARVVIVEQTWSEDLGRLISSLAPVLMMIGLAALYTEFRAPGFGLPGVVGLLCLGLVFFNQYLMGLADHTELLIIVLGVILLGFEIFVIPGFGVAGFAGFFLIGAGMILSFQDFVIPDPSMPWQMETLVRNILRVLFSFVFASLASLLVLRYIFPRLSPVIDGPYLAASLENVRVQPPGTSPLPGATGRAITPLRPAGKVEIDGENHDVVTQGDFLDRGSLVRVVEVSGNRIVVAPAAPKSVVEKT